MNIFTLDGWLISCSTLAVGMITYAYLNCIRNIHINRKKRLECICFTSLFPLPINNKEEDFDDKLDDDSWIYNQK